MDDDYCIRTELVWLRAQIQVLSRDPRHAAEVWRKRQKISWLTQIRLALRRPQNTRPWSLGAVLVRRAFDMVPRTKEEMGARARKALEMQSTDA
jgi:hypothetical protein